MEEKSNEITAIPKVLESIEIKGQFRIWVRADIHAFVVMCKEKTLDIQSLGNALNTLL